MSRIAELNDNANADLEYIVTHVFSPLRIPEAGHHSIHNEHALAEAVCSAAHAFGEHIVGTTNKASWKSIKKMLNNLRAIVRSEGLAAHEVALQLKKMKTKDILVFLIREQNAAVIFRKQEHVTTCESMEASPTAEAVMAARGRLICSYPGPAVEVPNRIFGDEAFQVELSYFLAHMNEDFLHSLSDRESTHLSTPAASGERDTCDPRPITELLTGILRAVGRPVEITRICKRVSDDVLRGRTQSLWRRSSLWLVIRVAVQSSLERCLLGRRSYKEFLLFFLCHLAEKAIDARQLSNPHLHSISSKISRCLQKLTTTGSTPPPEWLSNMAVRACSRLRSVLEERWGDVQAAQCMSAPWAPFELNLSRDVELTLNNSREYLRNALTNSNFVPYNSSFDPSHHPRGTLDSLLDADGAFFDQAYRDDRHPDRHVALYDVERAVEQEIDDWIERVRVEDIDDACVRLENLASKYTTRARKTYASDPEHRSIMLLTTIELWIALDKLVIEGIPMLADYSPEVPTDLLESLLARLGSNIDRIRHAFKYLSDRHSTAHAGWSVFSKEPTANHFAVRYVGGSQHLRDLRTRIELDTQHDITEKLAELDAANQHYAEVQRQVTSLNHSYNTKRDGTQSHTLRRCRKCQLSSELAQMTIEVYESPLPADPLQAAIVVFELDCPVSFNMWRSMTFHLLVDICTPNPEHQKRPPTRLEQHPTLSPYLVKHPRARITLASDFKPIRERARSIPSTADHVCVQNRLEFYGYDPDAHLPVFLALSCIDIQDYCTYRLPSGPYENLQRYLDATSHTSNEVVSEQSDCHSDLSILEFLAFGHLRSGGSIQWLNILRELRARTLSFRRPEVHFLLAQAASQIGPFTDDGELVWHQEMQESFCAALLSELESLILDVEANWLEGVTMATVSLLLTRMLASIPNDDISEKILGLLRVVRNKTYGWVQELARKATNSPMTEGSEYCHLLRDIAAICRSTFDVGPALIRRLICSADDVEPLIACSLYIHQHSPAKTRNSDLSRYSKLLLARDQRLSLTLEGSLGCLIQANRSSREGLELAIRKVWHGYRAGSEWEPLPPPNARWFWCATGATATQRSQLVHFNLLDGTLLVDGEPLNRLPPAIIQHPTYRQVFGERLFDVTPSDMEGMAFSTKGTIEGHRVHFSLRGNTLVIRAKHEDAEDALELIPQEKLEHDLPALLVKDHAHWLNLATCIIEIRPLKTLWERSSQNWELDCTPGRSYRIRKGRDRLVDIRSPTWAMVSGLLEPLDHPRNLLVIVTLVTSPEKVRSRQLSVILPRYGLSFFVDEDGELQSRNLRDMVYDEDQSVGTLFGLVNQLVLRPKHQLEPDLFPRCVLIPDGNVSFEMQGHHVCVEIDIHRPPRRPVTYQTYWIDSVLGCLTGNVSLTSRLFQAYLHALTSGGCNIDPLTGRTGTEEALSLLRSAGCRSIMKVDARDAHLLHLIASLCPSRKVHSQQPGQIIYWQNLPETSQHHELYTVAMEIKNHCEKVQLFNQNRDPNLFDGFPSHDPELFQRSALRAAYLLPSESSAYLPGPDHDEVYQARDLLDSSRREREHRAYTAAYAVYHKSTKATGGLDILKMVELWPPPRLVQRTAPFSLRYNKSWLVPELPSIWIEAYNQLRRTNGAKQFELLFSLPAMAYGSPKLGALVPTFVAFATCPQFQEVDPPMFDLYDLSKGYQPSREVLKGEIISAALPLDASPECSAPSRSGETLRDLKKRREVLYQRRLDSDVNATVELLFNSWPTPTPPALSLRSDSYNLERLNTSLANQFSACYRNYSLKEHLKRTQVILNDTYSRGVTAPMQKYVFKPATNIPPRASWSLTTEQLFARPARLLPPCIGMPLHDPEVKFENSSHGPTPLNELITAIGANVTNSFHSDYVADLQASEQHLARDSPQLANRAIERPPTEALRKQYAECRVDYLEILEDIKRKLGPASRNVGDRALAESGNWPRITPDTLFRRLASTSPLKLPQVWRNNIITLATLALNVQRARRLLRLDLDNLNEEFMKESENHGFNGWNAEEHSDWLLIQLQSDFLIRRVQIDVAMQMISPQSGENTTMQLNMGEGKSSVIVPITVTALADGNQMVRVIVPKALTGQMFQLLVDRLSGLVNRRIYYLPFSRSLGLDADQAAALHAIMVECMHERGVLLVQPEHVLSLKLISVEKQLSEPADSPLARHLLKLQRWIHTRVRDVLDESDEILHVRYQLVYTLGLQQPMEGFPERWTTTQQVLGLVKKYASTLRELFPVGVEYESGPSGSFPHFRILDAEAGKRLVARIAGDTMDSVLPNFKFEHVSAELKDAINDFISSKDISDSTIKKVEIFARNGALWTGLLLLRGLFATNILLYAFKQRRWRVDYGLAPERTMLAVPYRAKDVPAQRAEFGHPDVAILLTCLSYYYGGLTEEQLSVCFDLLLKQDDPSMDYDMWVQGCSSVPDFLRNFSGINIKSTDQWQTFLLPLFSRNQATIDFYLSRVVFPKEAKEFPSKLSCSGWDLAEKRQRLTTGFSGTNDGRYLLPMTITQHDPEHQRGTNAKVLSYLLQSENNFYRLTTHVNGERRNTREFLEMVVTQTPEIRVLLDVGAQMLDLQNQQLAATWLELSPDTSAAIYFNDEDDLTVLTRDGRTQLLLSSPFAQQLDQCVIYLDDAHTRGTDINFPRGFRAAVTLGPKVTKDRLTQGCMRMRKLGHGHSIMFFAPLEIDRIIRAVAAKGPRDMINASDILRWAIQETHNEIQLRAPQWAQQGMDHTTRYRIWSRFCAGSITVDRLKEGWLQPEAKTLLDLYLPRNAFDSSSLEVPEIRERCERLGVASLRDIGMDEEQEREVVHEIERERQVERPPKASPAAHSVHHDILSFVTTGSVPRRSKAFLPMIQTLCTTSVATPEHHIWSPSVWASVDFCTTIAETSGKMDDYLRPVQWLLSGKQDGSRILVILSPFEVHSLMPQIRMSEHVHLHLYTPRTIKSMKPCDDLRLYSIPTIPPDWTPPWALIDQLNVFAGQLYIRDHPAYLRLCRFLCVYGNDPQGGIPIEIARDGFIMPQHRPPYLEQVPGFQNSPLPFLRDLISLRRKGMSFLTTHMGKILDGRLLTKRDFDGDVVIDLDAMEVDD